MARFTHSPFISILLWYDRQITDLDHAWLLDSTIQWFFHKSRIRGYPPERGSYVELVIAGSQTELSLSREQILAPALAELARFFPEVRSARLIKSGILKEARATFSVTPGLDASRPSQRTAWPGLYLAGDWTATELALHHGRRRAQRPPRRRRTPRQPHRIPDARSATHRPQPLAQFTLMLSFWRSQNLSICFLP